MDAVHQMWAEISSEVVPAATSQDDWEYQQEHKEDLEARLAARNADCSAHVAAYEREFGLDLPF